MSLAWLTYPLALDGMRMFECGDLTTEQCDFYMIRWHFWYIADWVYALPTVAFFMCAIGLFIIGHFLSTYILGYQRFKEPVVWRKLVAGIRYLSYRGFRVESLGWNSAPVGILLLGLAGTLFFFLMDLAPGVYYWSSPIFGGSPALATRSGWMALACMPFVFATATKTNWITLVTGVSHEKLQVFHRWIAYAFFLLSLMHTFPFIVYHVRLHDMEAHFSSSLLFYWTGIVAIILQAWLTFGSFSTIRNLGYEFFKIAHFACIIIFMIVLFWHCDYTLSSWDYFVATAAIYVPCFAYPWLRTCFEYGTSQRAHISIEENNFIKITIPAKFTWKPGQHCFLRFTSFGLLGKLSSHPFTICSSPPTLASEPSELVFYLRHQGGLTKQLFEYAAQHPGESVPVLVDGPYGGINMKQYHDSEQLLVIAGGSGAGWILPFIERFVRNLSLHPSSGDEEKGCCSSNAAASGNEGPLGLRVVLATRDVSSRIWFLRTVAEVLAKYPENIAKHVLVQVYVTGDAAAKLDLPPASSQAEGVHSHSSDGDTPHTHSDDKADIIRVHRKSSGGSTEGVVPGKEYEGRPNLPSIIAEEVGKSSNGLGVFVCGPNGMLSDVRNEVAGVNLGILGGARRGEVYLHCEHFSWA